MTFHGLHGLFQVWRNIKMHKKAHRCWALLLVSISKLTIAGRRLAGYHCIVACCCPSLTDKSKNSVTDLHWIRRAAFKAYLVTCLQNCNRSCLGAAGNAANIPAGEVLDWLGVHVRLFAGRVDAPHVHHPRDLRDSKIECGAADYFPHAPVLSIQVLDQPWHLSKSTSQNQT